MDTKAIKAYLASIGSKGGKAKSEKKAASSRANAILARQRRLDKIAASKSETPSISDPS